MEPRVEREFRARSSVRRGTAVPRTRSTFIRRRRAPPSRQDDSLEMSEFVSQPKNTQNQVCLEGRVRQRADETALFMPLVVGF